MIGQDQKAPASPRGFWMHTYFEMQGQYLIAKCYLVAMDTPVFFELKLDTAPFLKVASMGHSWLHSHVSGEGIPVNLIGGNEMTGARGMLVNRAANIAQAIARGKAQSESKDFNQGHAAFAAANSLLASVERKNFIDKAARGKGVVSAELENSLPRLKAMNHDGRVAGQVIGAVLQKSRESFIGADSGNLNAYKTASVLQMVHNHRNHLKALGHNGLSTGRVIDEHGNIQARISSPIPSVNESVPQLAAAVSGYTPIVGASHADIVGSCIGCGSIGCY